MKSDDSKLWDVIVIGGGPAGMMSAARAGARGRSVLLLEKNERLGKKLSLTGGGRCNVTNNKPDVRTMLANYKEAGKFLFSTFTQHGVAETIAWFEERGVLFREENEGRLFPETNSAETIRETLLAEMEKQKVTVESGAAVLSVTHNADRAIFTVGLVTGETFYARSCIVASGGTSKPETGSTGDGFGWMSTLGHSIGQDSLALVPLILHEAWVSRMSGVVLEEVKIKVVADGKKHFSSLGKLLFTHTGVSGPTILNMSSIVKDLLANGPVTLEIDLFPGQDDGLLRTRFNERVADGSNRKLVNVLADFVPKTLAVILLEILIVDGETPGHSVRSEDRARLVSLLKRFPLRVKGLHGPEKAIVSSGGVSLTEINPKTMCSRLVPGLYVVGDMLDIDRPSGGYSLQLCWSSGYVAGSYA